MRTETVLFESKISEDFKTVHQECKTRNGLKYVRTGIRNDSGRMIFFEWKIAK